LVNLSEENYIKKKSKFLGKIAEWVKARDNATIIPFSVPFEVKISKMTPEERDAYLKANNTTSMVSKIIKTGFQVLHLCYFFTAGSDEVRAWTIHVRSASRRHSVASPCSVPIRLF